MIHEHALEQVFLATAPLAIVDLQMLLIKGLAVVGGALVGYLAGGWFIRLLGRFVFLKKVPPRVVGTMRLLGMAILGMLVYLWVFGNSTAGGLGGGGGWWPFGGKAGQGDNVGSISNSTEQPKTPPTEQPKQEHETMVQGRTLQIRLLGGVRVVDQRFYQPEGQDQAVTWQDLRKLLEKQRKEEPPLKTIEIVLFKDSVDRDNPAVTQLQEWAKEHSLTTKLASPAGELGREPDKTP
jgi:hypothetical protein